MVFNIRYNIFIIGVNFYKRDFNIKKISLVLVEFFNYII